MIIVSVKFCYLRTHKLLNFMVQYTLKALIRSRNTNFDVSTTLHLQKLGNVRIHAASTRVVSATLRWRAHLKLHHLGCLPSPSLLQRLLFLFLSRARATHTQLRPVNTRTPPRKRLSARGGWLSCWLAAAAARGRPVSRASALAPCGRVAIYNFCAL